MNNEHFKNKKTLLRSRSPNCELRKSVSRAYLVIFHMFSPWGEWEVSFCSSRKKVKGHKDIASKQQGLP